MTRAIIINPVAQTIEEVDAPTLCLDFYYKTIGCQLVQAVCMGPGCYGYIDEEGLLKAKQSFFFSRLIQTPIAGTMVLTGLDDDTGEDAALPSFLTLGMVKETTIWLTLEDIHTMSKIGAFDTIITNLDSGEQTRIPVEPDAVQGMDNDN